MFEWSADNKGVIEPTQEEISQLLRKKFIARVDLDRKILEHISLYTPEDADADPTERDTPKKPKLE